MNGKRRVLLLASLILLTGAATASAQRVREPIPPFALDLRGALARFKQDPVIAAALQVPATELPTRGLGITAGAHFYALRTRRITVGVGGEWIAARDSRTTRGAGSTTAGPQVRTALTGLAPQLSLNFGRREGWSYLSAGLGSARLISETPDKPLSGAARTRMLNYGGGARWFNTPHVAFTFDVRFYAISPREGTVAVPGSPRAKFMVLSAGVAFK